MVIPPLAGYVVFDLETTITEYMKRKASPFCAENWVVASGYLARNTNSTPGVHHQYHGHNRGGHAGWLADLLEQHSPRFLVGFNIKFDLLWSLLSSRDHEAYMAWVVRGGQIWDCQLVEYLLDGMVQESHMLSLDEVAPRYGGELKIDEVKAMWAAGINTDKIPPNLLLSYLCGSGGSGYGVESDLDFRPGDLHNTELIFKGQMAAAKNRRQVKSMLLNNGALLATVEMERNGLRVNVEKGRAQAKVLAETAAKLKASLTQYLPKDLPFEFKWNSRKQLSAFIFGGTVYYEQRIHQKDEQGQLAYAKKKVTGYELVAGGHVLEYDLDAMDKFVHYGSGKKKGQPKTKQIDVNDYDKPKLKWEEFPYKFNGLTKPRKQWAGKEAGVYSTAAEVIEELGKTTDIPFLLDFANLGAITKDLGTYYIVEEFDDEGVLKKAKGMLTLVQPDGIVHHTLNMTSTVTGRFSHSNPNSGNLPRGDDNSAKGMHTSLVKEMFESRWGADGQSISSDFTSLEVYCQAQVTKDAQLIADLRAGLDMHCARLSTVEGKPYEEVLLLCKGDKKRGIEALVEWATKRTHIKVFSFQRAYGSGAQNIADTLKVKVELVKEWVIADDKRYPGIVKYNEKMAKQVEASKVLTDKWMLHPEEKVQVRLARGHYTTFDGKRYVFQESPTPDFISKTGKLTGFVPTELKNYPMQGLGGEWMKAAMWMAVRAFYQRRNFGGKALLVNTVHDALYADSHKEVCREAGALIHASMQAASDYMEYHFDTIVEVPVPAETTHGDTMASEGNYEDYASFDALAQTFRTQLRKDFMNGFVPSYLQTGATA